MIKLLFTILLIASPTMASASSETELWSTLRERWTAYQKERKFFVDHVELRLSKSDFTESSRYKFLLEDNLGESWLFKAGLQQVDGAEVIDQLNILGGIPSTPFFRYKIDLNDRTVDGSIQKFLPNLGTFESIQISKISPSGAQQMAQHHLMSYLTLNHHVHRKQFIVVPGTNPKSAPYGTVYRIDNSVDFYLMGHDRFDLDYKSPMVTNIPSAGYTLYFRHILKKNLSIDVGKILALAEFYQKMPDDFYLNFFSSVKERGLMDLSGVSPPIFLEEVPEIPKLPTPEAFIEFLLNRKNRLHVDMTEFYKNLFQIRGKKWEEPKLDIKKFLRERIKNLDDEVSSWRKLNDYIRVQNKSESPPTRPRIEIAGSYRAHLIFTEALHNSTLNPQTAQIKKIDNALKKLKSLEAEEANAVEKQGIRNVTASLKLARENYLKAPGRFNLKQLILNANKIRNASERPSEVKPQK